MLKGKSRRVTTRKVLFGLLAILIAGGYGCATSRMYSGPGLTPDKIALVVSPLRMMKVDGAVLPTFGSSSKIELLPGPHTVEVYYGYQKSTPLLFGVHRGVLPEYEYYEKSLSVSVAAEAGHEYRVRFSIDSPPEVETLKVWIEDITGD